MARCCSTWHARAVGAAAAEGGDEERRWQAAVAADTSVADSTVITVSTSTGSISHSVAKRLPHAHSLCHNISRYNFAPGGGIPSPAAARQRCTARIQISDGKAVEGAAVVTVARRPQHTAHMHEINAAPALSVKLVAKHATAATQLLSAGSNVRNHLKPWSS